MMRRFGPRGGSTMPSGYGGFNLTKELKYERPTDTSINRIPQVSRDIPDTSNNRFSQVSRDIPDTSNNRFTQVSRDIPGDDWRDSIHSRDKSDYRGDTNRNVVDRRSDYIRDRKCDAVADESTRRLPEDTPIPDRGLGLSKSTPSTSNKGEPSSNGTHHGKKESIQKSSESRHPTQSLFDTSSNKDSHQGRKRSIERRSPRKEHPSRNTWGASGNNDTLGKRESVGRRSSDDREKPTRNACLQSSNMVGASIIGLLAEEENNRNSSVGDRRPAEEDRNRNASVGDRRPGLQSSNMVGASIIGLLEAEDYNRNSSVGDRRPGGNNNAPLDAFLHVNKDLQSRGGMHGVPSLMGRMDDRGPRIDAALGINNMNAPKPLFPTEGSGINNMNAPKPLFPTEGSDGRHVDPSFDATSGRINHDLVLIGMHPIQKQVAEQIRRFNAGDVLPANDRNQEKPGGDRYSNYMASEQKRRDDKNKNEDDQEKPELSRLKQKRLKWKARKKEERRKVLQQVPIVAGGNVNIGVGMFLQGPSPAPPKSLLDVQICMEDKGDTVVPENTLSYKAKLQRYCKEKRLGNPTYSHTNLGGNRFIGTVCFGSNTFSSTFETKSKDWAEAYAALEALKRLGLKGNEKDIEIVEKDVTVVVAEDNNKSSAEIVNTGDETDVEIVEKDVTVDVAEDNNKSSAEIVNTVLPEKPENTSSVIEKLTPNQLRLQQYCKMKNLGDPTYSYTEVGGNRFIGTVCFGTDSFCSKFETKSQEWAGSYAAREALIQLGKKNDEKELMHGIDKDAVGSVDFVTKESPTVKTKGGFIDLTDDASAQGKEPAGIIDLTSDASDQETEPPKAPEPPKAQAKVCEDISGTDEDDEEPMYTVDEYIDDWGSGHGDAGDDELHTVDEYRGGDGSPRSSKSFSDKNDDGPMYTVEVHEESGEFGLVGLLPQATDSGKTGKGGGTTSLVEFTGSNKKKHSKSEEGSEKDCKKARLNAERKVETESKSKEKDKLTKVNKC